MVAQVSKELQGSGPRHEETPDTATADRYLERLESHALLEFDPRSNYEELVKSCVEACATKGYAVFVFTGAGTAIHRKLKDVERAGLVLVSLGSSAQGVVDLPTNRVTTIGFDKAQFLVALDSLVASRDEVRLIIDNVSKWSVLQGFHETFKFLRQANEILEESAENRVKGLVLMIKGAHSQMEQNLFESLFETILEYDASGLSVLKPS